jgi:hypothetical protein
MTRDVTSGAKPATQDPDPAPSSRRSILKAAAGGAAGVALGLLGHPAPAEAAAGSAMLLGKANSAGTGSTSLTTKSTSNSLKVAQTGTGPGVSATVTGAARTALTASNTATASGTGGAIVADGRKNHGLTATTAATARRAITARNTGGGTGPNAGVAIRATAGTATDAEFASFPNPAAGEFAGAVGIIAVGMDAEAIKGFGQSIGVVGFSDGGAGVKGESTTGTGVYGISTSLFGVRGSSGSGDGVYGVSGSGSGVQGVSSTSRGVTGSSYSGDAVYGESNYGNGVYGYCGDVAATGVYGENPTGFALYSYGKAGVHGTLAVTGAVSKGGGSFKIDHPLDPANQFLYHSFVESPDMKNVYDGVVALDGSGAATIELPDWFDALNRDCRYQLTAMGAAMPNLHVSRGVAKNHFSIAGGMPGGEVSWQVTGIRKDAWAEANRIPVEEPKPKTERGLYLHPEAHGQPATKGIDHAFHAKHSPRTAASS